ncbi:hypothetical protein [Asticcacaulis solisilvae]|uniref:hypothetical protein n=1 Tax=Asticcacaulis solisilvae TaxID=1217274 RepID=UPI003FD80209
MPDSTSFTNPFLWWADALKLAPTNLNQSILPGWSFMTINENNSTSPETEQYVLARHSYGRQIGRMMDLVAEMANEASPEIKKSDAYRKFNDVVTDVDKAKKEAAGIRRQRLLEELTALKGPDFEALVSEARRSVKP